MRWKWALEAVVAVDQEVDQVKPQLLKVSLGEILIHLSVNVRQGAEAQSAAWLCVTEACSKNCFYFKINKLAFESSAVLCKHRSIYYGNTNFWVAVLHIIISTERRLL